MLEMGARPSVTPISGLIRSVRDYMTGQNAVSHTGSSSAAAPFVTAIEKVRDFVGRYAVDPRPENYGLLYRYCVLAEHDLQGRIDRLIATGTASEACEQPVMTEAELDRLASDALVQVRGVESVLARSRNETEGFGKALEGSAEQLTAAASPAEAVLNLVDLTKAMITRTRSAETELRQRSEAMADLQQSLSEARLRADTDALTGLSNRRFFERELGASFERCKASNVPLALAICDVDHFKSINDTFGHVTGDRVLKLIGNILESHCAGKGSVARFGGEEFVVLFEKMSGEDASEIIDAARRDLASRKIMKKETGEPIGMISFSAGVSAIALASEPGELLWIADRALYSAKACGRNLVRTANSYAD
jgi:diguanylate cyclase